MKSTRITYDPDGDILYVTFGQPTSATGYQLSDQILLRVDPVTDEAAGLTILNFSFHADAGKEIPLSGLENDAELKSRLLPALTSPPVAQFLRTVDGEDGVSVVLLSPSVSEAVVG